MKGLLRIPIYVVLVIVCALSVKRFLAVYNQRAERAAHRYDQIEEHLPEYGPGAAAPDEATGTITNPAPVTGTNPPPYDTAGGLTNLPPTALASSNAPPAITAPNRATTEQADTGEVHLGWHAAGALLSLLALALAGSYEISLAIGRRAHNLITSEEAANEQDAAYEEAERLWANGDHLGAVHSLREYLERHPRRVHAQFRIAEIYEKDLGNPLAAALEHEEILKFRLEPERWGWAAIHLCNLYYHLNQEAKAEALLHRIVNEFAQTQAARKARKRLGMPEDLEAAEAEAAAPETEEPAETEGGFKLPPGFRPKR